MADMEKFCDDLIIINLYIVVWAICPFFNVYIGEYFKDLNCFDQHLKNFVSVNVI